MCLVGGAITSTVHFAGACRLVAVLAKCVAALAPGGVVGNGVAKGWGLCVGWFVGS